MLRAALLASALLWACGQTGRRVEPGAAQGGRSANVVPGGAGAGGDAGSLSDAGAVAVGTEPIVTGGLTDAGGFTDAGAFTAGGGGGGSPSAGATGGAGVANIETVCALVLARGLDPNIESERIAAVYRQVLTMDCHYRALTCSVTPVVWAPFASVLVAYGPALWNCNALPADGFRLVYPGRKVTRGDAETLITLYVYLTSKALSLAEQDEAGLRDELRALMPASLADDAPSISICDSGDTCPTGGTGGVTGGTGGVTGGTGGVTGGTGGVTGGTGGVTNQAGAE